MLKEKYLKEVKPAMKSKFNYSNVHKIPKLEKVVVNSCTRDCVVNGKVVEQVIADLTKITGQKPVVARARKSIASFKLREGQALGASVTLRGAKMYEFLERLINITLPRVRDFRGVSGKSFDGAGNYTLGLKEQIIFPEIDYDKIDKVRGLNITVVTSAKNNEEGKELLTLLGMPFRR
jgi:large subunit ribosomal protein L5